MRCTRGKSNHNTDKMMYKLQVTRILWAVAWMLLHEGHYFCWKPANLCGSIGWVSHAAPYGAMSVNPLQ